MAERHLLKIKSATCTGKLVSEQSKVKKSVTKVSVACNYLTDPGTSAFQGSWILHPALPTPYLQPWIQLMGLTEYLSSMSWNYFSSENPKLSNLTTSWETTTTTSKKLSAYTQQEALHQQIYSWIWGVSDACWAAARCRGYIRSLREAESSIL